MESNCFSSDEYFSMYRMIESLKEREKLIHLTNQEEDINNEIVQNDEKIKIKDLITIENSNNIFEKIILNKENIFYTFNVKSDNESVNESHIEDKLLNQNERSLNDSIKYVIFLF